MARNTRQRKGVQLGYSNWIVCTVKTSMVQCQLIPLIVTWSTSLFTIDQHLSWSILDQCLFGNLVDNQLRVDQFCRWNQVLIDTCTFESADTQSTINWLSIKCRLMLIECRSCKDWVLISCRSIEDIDQHPTMDAFNSTHDSSHLSTFILRGFKFKCSKRFLPIIIFTDCMLTKIAGKKQEMTSSVSAQVRIWIYTTCVSHVSPECY